MSFHQIPPVFPKTLLESAVISKTNYLRHCSRLYQISPYLVNLILHENNIKIENGKEKKEKKKEHFLHSVEEVVSLLVCFVMFVRFFNCMIGIPKLVLSWSAKKKKKKKKKKFFTLCPHIF